MSDGPSPCLSIGKMARPTSPGLGIGFLCVTEPSFSTEQSLLVRLDKHRIFRAFGGMFVPAARISKHRILVMAYQNYMYLCIRILQPMSGICRAFVQKYVLSAVLCLIWSLAIQHLIQIQSNSEEINYWQCLCYFLHRNIEE